mmetsp:Transcript_32580/g.46994  ORF Transcript_32580/g.46994 Transcript_32580/m.46994 type:complete len:684 (-) Transcript_32580:592-2643(-)
MSWQRVPIGYSSLKQLLRNGLKTNESRNYWWPILTDIKSQAYINEYPDVIEAAEKLHVLISEPLLDHKSMSKIQPTEETELIESVSKNLIYVLKRNKKIEEVDYFQAISRILVKELRRIDVCYMIASNLLGNQDKFSAVSYEGNHCNIFAFKEMLKNYLPKTYLSLTTIGALDEKYLNLMFVDFFTEILPENLVLRIVDAYLLEGVKVLYRFGLGLIKGYKNLIKTGKYETAKDFWVSVKADAISIALSNEESLLFKTLGLPESLPPVDPFLIYSNSKNREFMEGYQLITNAYEVDRSFMSKMVRPMNISKNSIKALKVAAEETMTNKLYEPNGGLTSPGVNGKGGPEMSTPNTRKSSLHRSSISETVIGGRSSNHLEIKSSNLSNSNQKRLTIYNSPTYSTGMNPNNHSPLTGANKGGSHLSGGIAGIGPILGEMTPATLAGKSSILDIQSATTLISFLPENVVLEGLELSYSPAMHGWGISQLFSMTKDLSPSILLVKLLPPYASVVLGAFIATPLSSSNAANNHFSNGSSSKSLGDGTSFIFRLDDSHAAKYEWAGLSAEAGSEAAMNMFATASDRFLCFGSSTSAACAAIRIEDDLKNVFLGESDTYANPPLVEPSEADSEGRIPQGTSTYSFPVMEIEVFSGARSIMLAGNMIETRSLLSDTEAEALRSEMSNDSPRG